MWTTQERTSWGSRVNELLMAKRNISHGYEHVAVSVSGACSTAASGGLKLWALVQAEEQRREWERTKQELALTKRKLMESVRWTAQLQTMGLRLTRCGIQEELVLQLKTATRKLEETMRKRDKDVRAGDRPG